MPVWLKRCGSFSCTLLFFPLIQHGCAPSMDLATDAGLRFFPPLSGSVTQARVWCFYRCRVGLRAGVGHERVRGGVVSAERKVGSRSERRMVLVASQSF